MDKYFEFLSELVNGDKYQSLLIILHQTEFYAIIPNDENRGRDGVFVRDLFKDDGEGYKALSLSQDEPCTVLEMLIGLAFRMENMLYGSRNEKTMADCFWMLIDNLDLRRCDDKKYFSRYGGDVVHDIISGLLDRRYTYDGFGGLFPLSNAKDDQRNIEIGYQMNLWMMENFKF